MTYRPIRRNLFNLEHDPLPKPAPRLTNLRASSYSALSLMTRKKFPEVRSTTVLLVRRDGHVAMAGDGQVTVGETVMKASAKKVRRLTSSERQSS